MSESSRYTPDARPDGERGNVWEGKEHVTLHTTPEPCSHVVTLPCLRRHGHDGDHVWDITGHRCLATYPVPQAVNS